MKRHKTPIIEKKLATMNNTITNYFDVESAFKNGDISDEEFLKFCGKLNEAYRVEKLRGDKLSAELEQMEGRAESAEEALLVKADECLQWKARCEASEEMLEKFKNAQKTKKNKKTKKMTKPKKTARAYYAAEMRAEHGSGKETTRLIKEGWKAMSSEDKKKYESIMQSAIEAWSAETGEEMPVPKKKPASVAKSLYRYFKAEETKKLKSQGHTAREALPILKKKWSEFLEDPEHESTPLWSQLLSAKTQAETAAQSPRGKLLKLKKADLVKACQERGLNAVGSKAKLAERILAAEASDHWAADLGWEPDFTLSELEDALRTCLRGADLDKLSVNSVRKQLERHFGCDSLEGMKKWIREKSARIAEDAAEAAEAAEAALLIQSIVRMRASRNLVHALKMKRWDEETTGFLPQKLWEEEVAKGNASGEAASRSSGEAASRSSDGAAVSEEYVPEDPEMVMDVNINNIQASTKTGKECVERHEVYDCEKPHYNGRVSEGSTKAGKTCSENCKRVMEGSIDDLSLQENESESESESETVEWNDDVEARPEEKWVNRPLPELSVPQFDKPISKMTKQEVQEELEEYDLPTTGTLGILRKVLEYRSGNDMLPAGALKRHEKEWPEGSTLSGDFYAENLGRMPIKYRAVRDICGTSTTLFKDCDEIVEVFRRSTGCPRSLFRRADIFPKLLEQVLFRHRQILKHRGERAHSVYTRLIQAKKSKNKRK